MLPTVLQVLPARVQDHNVVATAGRVLVVDADPAVRRVVASRLESEGFATLQLAEAPTATRLSATDSFDAILLGVPSVDAPRTVLHVRDLSPEVALIVLLAPGSDSGEGGELLDLGADDYLVKPFSPRDLVARLRAVLRRARRQAPPSTRLDFGDLVVDEAKHEVLVTDVPVQLTAREFALLVFLAHNPGRVLTRQQLLDQVWGADAVLGDATVTEHVRRIRRRVEADPKHPRHITTVWSVGYRFDP
jgi:DNA-binding response OmpR family regulator